MHALTAQSLVTTYGKNSIFNIVEALGETLLSPCIA